VGKTSLAAHSGKNNIIGSTFCEKKKNRQHILEKIYKWQHILWENIIESTFWEKNIIDSTCWE
jgi:hypothetical protein